MNLVGIYPRRLVALVLLLAPLSVARAVILNGTGEPTRNTTAPTGALTNSGWQFQGQWGSFLGTPISSKHFIAAGHVGGTVGDAFVFRGVPYVTTAMYDDPATDLRIWRVCGVFPEHSLLYTGSGEATRPFVVFGRGTQRGDPVVIQGMFGPETKGWLWGSYDGVQRWGTNVVNAILDGAAIEPLLGSVGDLLQATFDTSGGADEAHLSVGDSSGGLFIKDGGAWRLAGINFAVESLFNTNSTGPGFSAAITDKGGLYSGGEGSWQQMPNLPADVPTALYATRISSNLPWIQGVLTGPPPSEPPPRLEATTMVNGAYLSQTNAMLDAVAHTFTVPQPLQNLFFRLSGCDATRITNITISGTYLLIRYE